MAVVDCNAHGVYTAKYTSTYNGTSSNESRTLSFAICIQIFRADTDTI